MIKIFDTNRTSVSESKHAENRPWTERHQPATLVVAISSALFYFGLSSSSFANVAVADTGISDSTATHSYSIPAGSLAAALNHLSRESGTSISTDSAEIGEIMTQGLEGKYTVPDALDHLLAGSGMQAVSQGNQYAIQRLAMAPGGTAQVERDGVLPTVTVLAKSSTGYTVPQITTATKTNTPLINVPQSVSVVTQEAIKDQNVLSMSDAVRYVPGVGISQGEGNRDALVFRGNRSTADFFVDGIRDDVQYFRDIYNIERVEVLKGPNGMIFGRGGSGGVINRVQKEADWNRVREITAQVGSWDAKRVALDIGQGMNDTSAVRLNAMYEDSGSFRNGVDLNRYGINPTVTLAPGAQTKVVLNAEYFKDERTADRGVPSLASTQRPIDVDVRTFFGDPSRSNSDTELKAVNALVEHKFDNQVLLRNRTRYANQDKFYENVYPSAAVNPATAQAAISAYNNASHRETFINQTDVLFSLNTGTVKHDMLAGLELSHQDSDSRRNTGYFNGTAATVNVPISNPLTGTPLTYKLSATDGDNNSITKNAGVYIQDQITLMPKWQAILGLRYDLVDVDFVNKNPAINQTLNARDNFWSPRAGLIYKPVDNVSVYGNYSLAYVPRAGEQLTSLSVTNAALEPEKFKNLEVGAKWNILPDLALTTALFQLDRTNVIVPDPNNTARSILADGQRNKGFELGLAGRITSAWSMMGGYTYQDGEITNTQSATIKAGSVLAELPKNTFSLWNRYDFNSMWGMGLGVVSRSKMYASTDNTVYLPGFTRVDAAVYARIDKTWRAQLNIENLFDKVYWASAHNNNNLSPGSPIAARLSLVANF